MLYKPDIDRATINRTAGSGWLAVAIIAIALAATAWVFEVDLQRDRFAGIGIGCEEGFAGGLCPKAAARVRG